MGEILTVEIEMKDFKLIHEEETLIATMKINGVKYTTDVTQYFSQENPHDEWLDYRLGLY